MPTLDDLAAIAEESAFIFTGSITRAAASTVPVLAADHTTVVVSVEDVIKAPAELHFAGREVTVQLQHPLSAGHFVFFADPVAVGAGIAFRERLRLDAAERREAVAAVERAYVAKMAPRLDAASLVALGTVGEVRHLFPPAERRGRVPWALAPFEIERLLKGKGEPRHVTLVGPFPASKWLPRAPALRAGLHAILILQPPPKEAIEHVPADERHATAFIAATSDIQPPDRLETLAKIISGREKE